MSDTAKIIEVMASRISGHPAAPDVTPKDIAEDVVRTLREAGYTIEPDWSDDMEAAPKDGTPVQVKNDRGVFTAAWHNEGPNYCLDEFWHTSNGKEWRDLRGSLPTHWKPISPLQDAGKERE